MFEEKVYIGTKIVKATPMTKHEFAARKGKPEDYPSEDGYMVKYEDGYESWSPKETFERAYREVSSNEKAMMV